jgi:hypothetical protein
MSQGTPTPAASPDSAQRSASLSSGSPASREPAMDLSVGALKQIETMMNRAMKREMKEVKSEMKEVKSEMKEVKSEMKEVKSEMKKVKTHLDRLDKRTGILVEEKARMMASRMFGSDFSERLLIKSIHEVVKLISKANDKRLPKDHGMEARIDAVDLVLRVLEPLLIAFVKSAVISISVASLDEVFDHSEFAGAKSQIRTAEELSRENTPDSAKICGLLIDAVKKMSTETLIGDEDEDKKGKRVKSAGRFKRKLERIKATFLGKNGLTSCSGPGIMFCCAVSCAPKMIWGDENSLRKWIEDVCDIFEYSEEVECDVRGSVMLIGKYATISCGEIKSSIATYSTAVKQMELRAKLIEFILHCVFGSDSFDTVTKKGHLFVLEAEEDDQRMAARSIGTEANNELSVFVHRIY